MLKKVLFLFIIFFSSSSFADCYFNGCYTSGSSNPGQGFLIPGEVGGNCGPDSTGALRFQVFACPDLPPPPVSCSDGRNMSTGQCYPPPTPPKRECVIPEDPFKADCKFPDANGTGQNCTDGSTVYAPMVCPFAGKWANQVPPGPGQSATCSDGSVIGYPNTCIGKYISSAKGMFGVGRALNIALNTMGGGLGPKPIKPVLRVAGTLVDGVPSIRAVVPMEAQINKAGLSAYASIDTSIPKITLGKAIAEYIKSDPFSDYAKGLVAAVKQGLSLTELMIDQNTGSVTPVGSLVPYSSNQIADLALSTHNSNPLPLPYIVPFIDYGTIPWLEPAIDAIEGDFIRIYDTEGQKAPINFPNITPDSLTSSYNPNTPSIVTIDENSPTTYLKDQPETSTLPDPKTNTNPTATDETTSPTATPLPGTPINPVTQETPDTVPDVPTLYPDTWKYFKFLPLANPFSFDLATLLPEIPETSCYYEIHKTVHISFVGDYSFDIAPCVPLQPLRTVLQWAFAVLSAWFCFTTVFRSRV